MTGHLGYMRKGLEDTYKILGLQDKILEIMHFLHEFCMKYEIEYCLMGGSALGAMRHGGFIPWDDDLDIFMTDAAYKKFRRHFQEYGDKDRFYLQEQGKIGDWVRKPKLRMNGTAYLEPGIEDFKMHHGIFIDIFILHSCPDHLTQQLWQCLWSKYIVVKALSNQHYKKRRGAVSMLLWVLRMFPPDFLLKRAYKELYRYDERDTRLCCHFVGKPLLWKGIYERADFFPARLQKFETIELLIPARLEDFLTKRYGDYKKLPSTEKICYDQHAAIWDTEHPFTMYVNGKNDFSDEQMLI